MLESRLWKLLIQKYRSKFKVPSLESQIQNPKSRTFRSWEIHIQNPLNFGLDMGPRTLDVSLWAGDLGFGIRDSIWIWNATTTAIQRHCKTKLANTKLSLRENTILLVGDDIILFWKMSARHHPRCLHLRGAWKRREILRFSVLLWESYDF